MVFDQTTDGTYSGVVSGSGTLTKTGSGKLWLYGTNTYTGGTILDEGTVWVDSDAALGDASGTLTFDGGTLKTAVTVSSARAVTLEAGGGTFDCASTGRMQLSGVVSGSGSLTARGLGGGRLVLTGTNTYTGGTIIKGGTVVVSADANLGAASGSLTLDGGILETTASFSSSRAVTLATWGG